MHKFKVGDIVEQIKYLDYGEDPVVMVLEIRGDGAIGHKHNGNF